MATILLRLLSTTFLFSFKDGTNYTNVNPKQDRNHAFTPVLFSNRVDRK